MPRLPVDMTAGPPPGQSTTLDRYTEKLMVQIAEAFTIVSERQNSYCSDKRSCTENGTIILVLMTLCDFTPTGLT